jgi:hypothetical protein
MNIFVLDNNSELAAKYHTDRHVIKMILESAQMMCTAVSIINNIETPYKPTHKNHPCNIWLRESLANFLWLGNLAYHLNQEYRYRFDHNYNHKSFDVLMTLPYPEIPNFGQTPFAQAMPEKYKDDDAVKAYRKYYMNDKKYLFNWTKREMPYWIFDF